MTLSTHTTLFAPGTGRPRPRRRSTRPSSAAQSGGAEQQRTLVQRPGLVNRLRTAAVDVVVIAAPLGYGKTGLVSEWEARDGRPFARVTVDPADDAARLGVRIADCIDSVADDVRRADRRPRLSAEQVVAEAATTVAAGGPVVVVVDDVDALADRRTGRLLALLADELPAGSVLALVGRTAAMLPVPRWRASGRLFELSTGDLQFRDREAVALLRARGVILPQRQIAALNRSLEGWPAGLDLAARTLATGDADIDDLLSEGVAPALEYLRRELLADLPADALRFLTHASVLRRLSPQLCAAITSANEPERKLEELARTNLFVTPAAPGRTSYVLHPAFRQALRRELQRREPDQPEHLHRRAAAFCAEQGDIELALEHACAARDRAQLASLVEESALPFLVAADEGAVGRWLALLDDETVLAERPTVAAIGALALAFTGRSSAADEWLDAGEVGPFPVPLRALAAPASPEELLDTAEQALAALSASSPWHPALLVLLGRAREASGDPTADRLYAEAADAAAAFREWPVESAALAFRCLLATKTGRWGRADALAEAVRRCVRERHLDDHPTTVFARAASARTALRHGDWATVQADLEHAHALLPQLTDTLALLAVPMRLEIAQVHLALGDTQAAGMLLDEIEGIYERQPRFGLFRRDTIFLRLELGRTHATTSTLTAAELRLLPLLTTHLSFREIATQLYVSRNTVKTQAMSVYRKLGVSSRGEAVDRASHLGLVTGGADADCA
jgi:LuxR family transcriptional regulator, maltose regulon positive regulatory protein